MARHNSTTRGDLDYPNDDRSVKSIVAMLANDADTARAIVSLIVEHRDTASASAILPALTKVVGDVTAMRSAMDKARDAGLTPCGYGPRG